jgi:hypothetical protein
MTLYLRRKSLGWPSGGFEPLHPPFLSNFSVIARAIG